ncbi:MAG TPA: rRNA maturation RNase YbeY [Bacteroidales bacterium]|nr:rRNA maturation RNase YbeY [Bacteroidales bacterium]HPA12893.1 rRNA maturation RNase YbeY [Bacteroidales bacterium]HQO07886.1 rRNA maturation RNase YbeY [Bacteroidales bacterium]HQP53924.1 rRNA maturation RNase YbeY [Bacteroidales bacterium]
MNFAIYFFNEDVNYRIRHKRLIKDWIQKTILKEGKTPGSINIILCSDEYLVKLNEKYLKHDTFTDIITFDNSDKEIVSGDLYISIQRVKENALTYLQNTVDELHRVIIHGILHLCGYDDKSENESAKMRAAESFYLSKRPVNLTQ